MMLVELLIFFEYYAIRNRWHQPHEPIASHRGDWWYQPLERYPPSQRRVVVEVGCAIIFKEAGDSKSVVFHHRERLKRSESVL